MNILFVIRDMFMGGAGKQLGLTASALCDRGHDVFLYTYIGESMEHVIDKRITYLAEPNPPSGKLSEYIKSPVKIRKIVKSIDPKVVVSWRANAGCLTVLGCINLRSKIIFSERTDPYMETNRLLKIATKICDFSDGGVFQTEKAKAFYKRLDRKSIVCPNPVVSNNQNLGIIPMECRKKEIAWVGRFMNSQKRMDIALRAFSVILQKFPDYEMSFYGDGVDMDYAKGLATELGLSEHVRFHGAKKDIINIISQSRALILSSDYEGIPNVIIEAFMAGTPVVSTDCSPGGARVLIDNEHNGFVVPIRDYSGLADRTIQLIGDVELSNLFVTRSRCKLSEFMPGPIFDKWDHYIRKVAEA